MKAEARQKVADAKHCNCLSRVLSIAGDVEIVPGFRFAVAYNLSTQKIYELDRSIGAFFLTSLPARQSELVSQSLTCDLIVPSDQTSFEQLIDDLIEKHILVAGNAAGISEKVPTPSIPRPDLLALEILTACNFNCRHCYLGEHLRSREQLRLPAIQSIIPSAKQIGVKRIQITGGNPSLHPDILEILELLNDHSFEIIYFSNGSRLTQEILSCLKRVNASLHVSAYGMSDSSGLWLTGYKQYFTKWVESLEKISELWIVIRSLDFMVVKENIHEIPDFVEFCQKHSYPYRFDSPADVGNAKRYGIESEREQIIDFETTFEPLEGDKSRFRFVGCEFDQPAILANGDVTFCILSNRTYSDHTLGNIHNDTLAQIWGDKLTKQLFNETSVDVQEPCRKCEYKYVCGGICPFSRKFHQISLNQHGEPDCLRYQNQRFRSWGIERQLQP